MLTVCFETGVGLTVEGARAVLARTILVVEELLAVTADEVGFGFALAAVVLLTGAEREVAAAVRVEVAEVAVEPEREEEGAVEVEVERLDVVDAVAAAAVLDLGLSAVERVALVEALAVAVVVLDDAEAVALLLTTALRVLGAGLTAVLVLPPTAGAVATRPGMALQCWLERGPIVKPKASARTS